MKAAPAAVWGIISDRQSLFICIPGAVLQSTAEDGSSVATITIAAGEFSASFSGIVRLETIDERTVTVRAHGKDRLGMIHADADVHLSIEVGGPELTYLQVDANFEFSGVLAPAARSAGRPAARLLMKRFATCVVERLQHPVASAGPESGRVAGPG